jgi:hypothetical protein
VSAFAPKADIAFRHKSGVTGKQQPSSCLLDRWAEGEQLQTNFLGPSLVPRFLCLSESPAEERAGQ